MKAAALRLGHIPVTQKAGAARSALLPGFPTWGVGAAARDWAFLSGVRIMLMILVQPLHFAKKPEEQDTGTAEA